MLLVIFGIGICVYFNNSKNLAKIEIGPHELPKNVREYKHQAKRSDSHQIPLSGNAGDLADEEENDADDGPYPSKYESSISPDRPCLRNNKHKVNGIWTDRKDFEIAFQNLIAKLPSEIHTRDYLRTIEGTGKEKLREIGLRARAYKGFFDAWEKVHMYEDCDGNTFVRNDIIPYYRSTIKSGSLTDDDDESDITKSLAWTVRAYEQYRGFLADFTNLLFPWYYPFYPDLLALKASFARGGRGMVLTGGDNQARFMLTTIASFRKLGCKLPIEVMYLGPTDLSDDYRADLEAIPGVVTRDIAAMVNDKGWELKGWAAKPFAILLSSFREVIFVDADSMFFSNPEEMFDDPGYKKTGALFFKDRLVMPENKKEWLQKILPRPFSRNVRQSRFWKGESGHMQDSGVVLVDKWRHFVAMLLVTLMNGPDRDKRDGSAAVYTMVYGK
jgi:alpha 1,3-mannosyltransferase